MMFNKKSKIFIFFIIYISLFFYINCQDKESSEEETLSPKFNQEDLINKINEENENKSMNKEMKENIIDLENILYENNENVNNNIEENKEEEYNIETNIEINNNNENEKINLKENENKSMNKEEKENIINLENIFYENNNIEENKEEEYNNEANTEEIKINNENEKINIKENEEAIKDIFDNLNQNNETENIIKTEPDNKKNIEYNEYIDKNMYNTEEEGKLEKLKVLFKKYLFLFHHQLLEYVPKPYDYLFMFALGYFFMKLFTKGKSSIYIKKKKKVDESIVFEIELKLREILKFQDKLKEKKNSDEIGQKPKIENLIKMPDETININKLIEIENKLNILMEDLCKRNKDDSVEKKLQNNICELQNKILEDIKKLDEASGDEEEEEEEEDDNEENEKKNE